MKRSYFFKLVLFGIVLTVGTVGCVKKNTKGPTPIGSNKTALAGPGTTGPIDSNPPPDIKNVPPVPKEPDPTVKPGDNTDLPPLDLINGMIPDREKFRNETIYFEFDRSTIRPSETAKAGTVANYLKQNAAFKVQVEGHCDERGTEEYNR